MFEIPDDDDFWNDVPLEGMFLPTSSVATDTENRAKLRVPDTTCIGKPVKRLCTVFNRDGSMQPEAENKYVPQLRSITNSTESTAKYSPVNTNTVRPSPSVTSSVSHTPLVTISAAGTEKGDSASEYEEVPFHIPFSTTSVPSTVSKSVLSLNPGLICPEARNVSVSSTSRKMYLGASDSRSFGSTSRNNCAGTGISGTITRNTCYESDKCMPNSRRTNTCPATDISDTSMINSSSDSIDCRAGTSYISSDGRSSDTSRISCSDRRDLGIGMRNTCSDITSNNPSTKITFHANTNRAPVHDQMSNKEVTQHSFAGDSTCGKVVERSRLDGSEAGEAGVHVTPKRRRKFPGPAGILPLLGPGRNLDMLPPVTLYATTPVTNKSPQNESLIICSQLSDDVFRDSPWEALISDMGEDGQKLLKKFSISSTLLKAGKKQLNQGKAALIFGIIDSIESHGSEASVTIRDTSGRMQGTIHRELLKDHESELQIGTVLVLKQVSIISLSHRNHYLNITPNNVVALYRTGQNSLKSQKFHVSQDSLRSVLSALEKKTATDRCMNNGLMLTPSSSTGSSCQSLDGSGTNTPQLFGVSPSTPVPNQRLFNPWTESSTPPPGLRTPIMAGVRDVSVIDGPNSLNERKAIITQKFRNNCSRPGMTTPVPSEKSASEHIRNVGSRPGLSENSTSENIRNTVSRCGMNTPSPSDNSISEHCMSDISHISTPNTNFKIIPIQGNMDSSRLNLRVDGHLNQSENYYAGTTSSYSHVDHLPSTPNLQRNSTTMEDEQTTPSTNGKSKWKFKSPPNRNVNLATSPDLSAASGNCIGNQSGNTSGIRLGAFANIGTCSKSGVINSTLGYVSGHNTSTTLTSGNGKTSGHASRSCQLRMQTSNNRTEVNSCEYKSVNRGTSSDWSIRTSGSTEGGGAVNGTEKERNSGQEIEDSLWEDDLSDDFLSQLSEDMA